MNTKKFIPILSPKKTPWKTISKIPLKVLKIKTCNEGCERVMLKSGEILAQLKATNGHAIQNIVPKKR